MKVSRSIIVGLFVTFYDMLVPETVDIIPSYSIN